jgi:hypothetical protein
MSKTFVEAARDAFLFLEETGFRCVRRESSLLRYEADRVFVTVTWDPYSGEINVFIGLRPKTGEPEDGFSLSDLLDMEAVNVPERKTPFQVAEEKEVYPFLKKLAEDTRVYGKPALTGDRMFFRRLKNFRNVVARTSRRETEVRRARSAAENAWQKREFEKVVDLYTSIQNELSGAERSKLEYAKKHTPRQA